MKNNYEVRIGKMKLANPVIAASGCFGYGEEYSRVIDVNRFGGIVTKAVTLKPMEGNPAPRITETAGGMLNAIGLQNVGVERFIKEKMPFLKKIKPAVIVNVAGESMEEYAEVARLLDRVDGIDALEINISCPNVKQGGISFGTRPDMAYSLVSLVRRKTKLPVIPKLTPNVTDPAEIAKACERAGCDALTAINTLLGMAIDVKTRKPKLANMTGGLSGPAIKPVALRIVYDVAKAVRIPVIACGGIINYEDALEFLIAGAVAFQIGTVNFVNPCACVEILAGINNYLKENKLSVRGLRINEFC